MLAVTSTEVQMLTPKELRQVSCAALISEAIASTLTGSTVEHLYGFKSE